MRKKILLVLFSLLFLIISLEFAGKITIHVNEEMELEQEVEVSEQDKETNVIIVEQEIADGLKLNGGPLLAYMQLDLAEFNANLPEVLPVYLMKSCFMVVGFNRRTGRQQDWLLWL